MIESIRERRGSCPAGSVLLIHLLLSVTTCAAAVPDVVLDNGTLRLRLQVSDEQVPYIAECQWRKQNLRVFADAGTPLGIGYWLSKAIRSAQPKSAGQSAGWQRQGDDVFIRALATRQRSDLQITWVVELARNAPLVQLHVRLRNTGHNDIPIDRFPGWMAEWMLPGERPTVKYWEALTYQPHVEKITAVRPAHLHSRVYSSDRRGPRPGKVPYWQIRDSQQIMCFAIAWCGGWRATIQKTGWDILLRVSLPPSETQLVLHAGEQIAGPVIEFMPYRGTEEIQARAAWIKARERLAHRLYGGPRAAYPFIYNHWYSAGRNLTKQFLAHQVEALRPYGFDVFVLDDGWFEQVGDWTPAKDKFGPGELEGVFALIHDNNLKTGIWSCPWLVYVAGNDLPPEVDRPPFLREYMKAYALDLAGYDFEGTLLNHIQSLKDQFDIDWWKYDQELFGEGSRHGRMKNIVALQQALAAVRRRHPDLIIESCMSGGRMINAFTDSIAQIHWIRDGGRTGYEHARTNVQEALGAIDFLMPAKVQRWTNRPNEVTGSTELLKCYCRSAMIGVWGVSTDLYKISPEQKKIIEGEVKNYRRLNEYKPASLYQILYPGQAEELAGVVYYSEDGDKAALLLFRWGVQGRITQSIKLGRLTRDLRYEVTTADVRDQQRVYSAATLAEQGLPVEFSPEQLSAVYFVEAQ
ncbi:MAG: alpha-galactosidase [Phycisphaerales bacterium]|nr:MAG: alpha-galactosidase [Phycisphaerales bacterium]